MKKNEMREAIYITITGMDHYHGEEFLRDRLTTGKDVTVDQ